MPALWGLDRGPAIVAHHSSHSASGAADGHASRQDFAPVACADCSTAEGLGLFIWNLKDLGAKALPFAGQSLNSGLWT